MAKGALIRRLSLRDATLVSIIAILPAADLRCSAAVTSHITTMLRLSL